MRNLLLVLAIVAPSTVLPSENAPFKVDIDTMHEIALATAYNARPELSVGELLPEYRVEAHCDFNPLVGNY